MGYWQATFFRYLGGWEGLLLKKITSIFNLIARKLFVQMRKTPYEPDIYDRIST